MTTGAQALTDLRKHVSTELIGRDAEIDLILLAIAARQHVFILGEPGIAKTAMQKRIAMRIEGCEHFELDMGPFTAPEDIFGPLSISALKQDRYKHATTGMAVEADLCTFDEWARCGAASLQSCLRLWNERSFRDDGKMRQARLSTGIFLSNHMLDQRDAPELAAVFDRILLRHVAEPIVDAESLKALDRLPEFDPTPPTICTWADIEAIQAEVQAVRVPEPIIDLRAEIFGGLVRAGLRPSNRRYRESMKAMRAAAVMDGCSVVEPQHAEILTSVFWELPEQRREVERIVWGVCSPGMKEVSDLIDEFATIQDDVDKAIALPGPDRETACSAARQKIKRTALEVRRLTGKGDKADQALADLWRRLQGSHDRILTEGMDLPAITLDVALGI